MIREIEYRAKNNLGEWVYGHVAVVSLWSGFSVWKIFNDSNGVDGTPIDPNTIGQYTGLKDKNDVKIFEGDSILLDDSYDIFGGESGEVMEVVFNDGCFTLRNNFNRNAYHTFGDSLEFLEVVGNVYENKGYVS